MSEFIQKDHVRDDLSAFQTFTFLWKYTKGHRIEFFLYCGILFLGSMLSAYAALRFGLLIAKIVGPTKDVSTSEIIILAGLEVANVVLGFFGRRGLSSTALFAIFNLRTALFLQMKKLPMSYYDREPAGRIVTRLTHDVDTLEIFYSGTLARLISVTLTAASVIIIMLQNTLWLGAITALLTLPSIVLVWSFRKKSHEIYRNFSRANSAITARLAEFLNGMSVIRSFALENWTKKLFGDRIDEYMKVSNEINHFNAWMRAAALFLTNLPMIFLFSVGSYLVATSVLALSILVAYIKLADRLARPAGALMMEIHLIQTATSSSERLNTFLSEPTEVIPELQNEKLKLEGNIKFQNISMKYSPEFPWVLDNFSLDIQKGQRVGIMGRTGSGKTTLISLLTRLYPYQEGKIKLDDKELEDFDLTSLRSQVAFVSQNTYLMPGTIRDNLTLGEIKSDTQIWAACKETGLSELLTMASRSLDTEVQTQGSNFSQGEAQLFALTRALLQDPSIMVLDEATANLDTDLEAKVQNAIEKVTEGRTSLFIAHRLSTLTRCERVIILQNGKIVDEITGTDLIQPKHDVLMHLERN